MKKQFIKKFIAIILAITLTFVNLNYSPGLTESLAENLSKKNTNNFLESISNNKSIVREDISLRTNNSSTYILEDGSKLLEVFGENIRFKKNGQLLDYDSSLKKLKRDDKNILSEILDTGLLNESVKDDYVLSNESGDSKLFFAEKISDTTPVVMSKDNYAISFALKGNIMITENEANNNTISYVKSENKDILKTLSGSNIKQTIFDQEDNKELNFRLVYTSLNNGIKEDIILNSKPEIGEYKFNLSMEGLNAQKDSYGNIMLSDINTRELKAMIPSPCVQDNSGEISYEAVEYTLSETESGYELVVTVSEEYLNNAVYPVIIDPSIIWNNHNFINAPTGMPATYRIEAGFEEEIERQLYVPCQEALGQLNGKYVESALLNATIEQIYEAPQMKISNIEERITRQGNVGYNYAVLSDNSFGSIDFSNLKEEDSILIDLRSIADYIARGNESYGIALTVEEGDNDPYVSFYGWAVTGKTPSFEIVYRDAVDVNANFNNDFEISAEQNGDNIDVTWDKYSDATTHYGVFVRENDGKFVYKDMVSVGENETDYTYSYTIPKNADDEYILENVDIRVVAFLGTNGILSNIFTLEKDEDEAEIKIETEAFEGGGEEEITEKSTSQVTYSPTIKDTDGDGLEDGYEVWDFNTLWNTLTADSTEENPVYNKDSDGDGLPDGYEVFYQGTNPGEANDFTVDSDGDLWTDLREYQEGTDPWLSDSDFDNIADRSDDYPRKTDGYTRQTAAAASQVHIGLYDRTYNETENGVTYTYVKNKYNGLIKKIDINYGSSSLNKSMRYFYDKDGNNTAIIESYDNVIDPNSTKLICITYTYDENGNNTFICDQSTRYRMYYNEDGKMINFVIGDNSNNVDETQTEIDSKSLINYKNNIITNNEGEDGDTSQLEEGDMIRLDDIITNYKNGQNIKNRTTTYKVPEDDFINTATVVYTYFNGRTEPTYVTELNQEEKILTLTDYSNIPTVITYEYTYTENGMSVSRGDDFTKNITETEIESENGQEGRSSKSLTYGFKDILNQSITYATTSTSISNSSEDETALSGSLTTLYNGSTYDNMGTNDGDTVNTHLKDSLDNTVVNTIQTKDNDTTISYDVDINGTVNDKNYDYTYDMAGNIIEIKQNNIILYRYGYDPHGRLTEEKDYTRNLIILYDYNDTGNLRGKSTYTMSETSTPILSTEVTKLYSYGNSSWPDQLTAYNGQNITYDTSGNPINYRGGMQFTWQRGRSLSTVTFSNNTSASYKYNENNLRNYKRAPDNTITKYEWDEDKLIREQLFNNTLGTAYDIWYFYDDLKNILGYEYSFKDSNNVKQTQTVYYEKNMQGDVIGLLDDEGNEFATYTYDAWGNITSTTCDTGYETAYGLNHITYRSYYRDNETGFYYLQSRYYDSETGRFLNADEVKYVNIAISSMFKDNLYIYCNGNPVNSIDPTGHLSLKKLWKKVKKCIRKVISSGNEYANAYGIDTTSYGAFLLCMKEDRKGVYHADFDCWQSYFGYTELYDFIFDISTSMKPAKKDFTYKNKKYILWAWKGDYINLGAGAELGIYEYFKKGVWRVNKKLAIPMKLELFYKNKKIISYSSGKEWWITGFNPKYKKVKAKKLKAKYTLDFSKDREMFNAIYHKYDTDKRFTFNTAFCLVIFEF